MATEKYHIAIRLTHWAMAAIIIGLIALGWYMSDLPKEDAMRGTLYGLHKSFGSLLLILFFVRLIIRLMVSIPALPAGIPSIQQKLAHIGHKLLYLFMLIVPLSGYAMSNLYGYGVNMFGINLPKIFPENKALANLAHDAHGILPYILLAIVAIHVGAALQHRFFDKPENDVLGRMI